LKKANEIRQRFRLEMRRLKGAGKGKGLIRKEEEEMIGLEETRKGKELIRNDKKRG